MITSKPLLDISAYDLTKWTVIAYKERQEFEWRAVEGAPMTIAESWALEDKKLIFRAQRKVEIPGREYPAWELVVQARRNQDNVAPIANRWFRR